MEKKLKVLMLGWELPPFNSGGLGVACYGLSKALSENTDVLFVLPKRVDIDVDFLKLMFAGNVKITAVDSPLLPYITPDQYMQLKNNSSLYGSDLFEEVKRYAREAKKIARQQEFDIIHAHDWLSFEAGIAAKEVSGKPLIAHVHSTEYDRCGGINVNKKVYEIEKEGMKKADRVITVSHHTRRIIEKNYSVRPEVISVVHNRINADEFVINKKTPLVLKKMNQKIVLFAGRITLQKGPEYFLQVAKKVVDIDDDILFVMAGSGDMERKIMNDAALMGISDKVLFAGFLRGEELTRLYNSADLFVMPSVSEPFGIVALESLLHDTPVIVSKQSGVSEVVTNVMKVDFWDIDEMVNKILAVLHNSSLKKTLRINAKSEIKNFNWKTAANDCQKIYKQLVD